MDVYAELSARQQRPAHPTMAATTARMSPTLKFPVIPTSDAPMPEAAPVTTVAVPTSTRSSQETLSSPSSPHRITSASIPSTGSSPTKTSSSSSSYEFPTTFTQFHPSNKPTAPLYRPAALRSADYPAPQQPFLRRSSFSFKEAASVKKDHWKVSFYLNTANSSLMPLHKNALILHVNRNSVYSNDVIIVVNAVKFSVIHIPRWLCDCILILYNSPIIHHFH
jgi:hypothetical protein